MAAVWLVATCVSLWPDLQGDTYVHLTFARNLAAGEFFTFNPGEPSRGSSSPAWTLLLGVLHLLGGEVHVVALAKAASLLFALVALLASAVLAGRLAEDPLAGGCAAIALATVPAFATWTVRAMETSLFLAIVLGVFCVCSSGRPAETPLRAAAAGFVLGLCALARPEGVLLAAPAALLLVVRKRKGDPGVAYVAVAVATAAAVVLPYAAWLLVHFGSPFPSSVARIEFARQFAERRGPFWLSFDYVRLFRDRYAAVSVLALAGFAATLRFRTPTRTGAAVGLAAWTAVSAALYTIVLPGIYGQRYFLPGFLSVPILASLSLLWVPPSWRSGAAILFVASLYPDLRGHLDEFRETRSYVRNFLVPWDVPARREMADWVRAHVPPDATIAAKEVDQLAYFGHRRVLSLDGILDTRVLPYLRAGRLVDFLRESRATHVLVEENLYEGQPQLRRSDLAPLAAAGLAEGASKEIGGARFELVHRTKYVGRPASARDVYWYLYRVSFPTAATRTSAILSPARPSQSSGTRAAPRDPRAR